MSLMKFLLKVKGILRVRQEPCVEGSVADVIEFISPIMGKVWKDNFKPRWVGISFHYRSDNSHGEYRIASVHKDSPFSESTIALVCDKICNGTAEIKCFKAKKDQYKVGDVTVNCYYFEREYHQ